MNPIIVKIEKFFTILIISGVIGTISEFFGVAGMSYFILMALIILDTVTGTAKAIRLRQFNSKVLIRLLIKFVTYTTAIITIRLLEIGILSIYKTTIMSQVTAAYLMITETICILENITILGVPLPANFVKLLLSYIKIPGFDNILQFGKDREKDIQEIDDIINYQIPVIEDEYIKKLLEIKFEIWKRVVIRLDEGLNKNNTSNELFYYKAMAITEVAFKEMDERWNDEIPQERIGAFKSWHQARLDNWLAKVREICYSEKNWQEKKEEIIDSIIVNLYQSVIDVQKGVVRAPK